MTEQQLVEEIAERTHLPADEVAAVLAERDRLVRVHPGPAGPVFRDDDRDYVPLDRLPMTRGEHDGYPLGSRGEAVSGE